MYNNNSLLGLAMHDPKTGQPYGKGTGNQMVNEEYNRNLQTISSQGFTPFLTTNPNKININPEQTKDWKYTGEVFDMIRKGIRSDVKSKGITNIDQRTTASRMISLGDNPIGNILDRTPPRAEIEAMKRRYHNNLTLDPKDKGYGWAQYILPKEDIFPLLDDQKMTDFIRKGFPKIAKWDDNAQDTEHYNDIRTYQANNPQASSKWGLLNSIIANLNEAGENISLGGDTAWTVTNDKSVNDPRSYTYGRGYDSGDYTMFLRKLPDGTIDYGGLDEYDFNGNFLNKYFKDVTIPGTSTKVGDVGEGLLNSIGGLAGKLGIEIPYLKEKQTVDKLLQTGGKPYTMYIQGDNWNEATDKWKKGQLQGKELEEYLETKGELDNYFKKLEQIKQKKNKK